MHFRRSAQDWINQRQRDSRQSMEAAPEFVADQKSDGNILDRIRWTKEPNHGRALFAPVGRAPERNRAEAVRNLFQIRICSQSMGPGRIALRAYGSAATKE